MIISSKNRGFTLIELLVVIAIIGLLASVVLAAVGTARNKGTDAAVKSQLNAARSQGELFASNNGNSYTGLCAAASSAQGMGAATAGGILYTAGSNTGNQANITTAAATAGAYNYVTCHDSAGAWMAEAPLTGSVSGTPRMWCVDSTGASKQTAANIAASTYACP